MEENSDKKQNNKGAIWIGPEYKTQLEKIAKNYKMTTKKAAEVMIDFHATTNVDFRQRNVETVSQQMTKFENRMFGFLKTFEKNIKAVISQESNKEGSNLNVKDNAIVDLISKVETVLSINKEVMQENKSIRINQKQLYDQFVILNTKIEKILNSKN